MLTGRLYDVLEPEVVTRSPSFLVREVIVLSASTKSELALERAVVSDAFVVVSEETAARS